MDTIGVTGRKAFVSDLGMFSRQIGNKRALWPSRVVREYFGGVVARTLNRWKNDPALGFPQPTTINGLDYYDPQQIEDFALRCRAVAEHEAKKAAEGKAAVEVQATNKTDAAAQPEAKGKGKSKAKITAKEPARPRRARYEHEVSTR
jgi:hypothetical protein